MREPGWAGYITDGIDARLIRSTKRIDHDAATIGFNSSGFKPDSLNIPHYTYGGNYPVYDDLVGLALFVFDCSGYRVVGCFERCDLGSLHD